MAFTKSTVATNNISNLANKPLESAATLKQKFDQYGIDDKARFNSLIDELEATTGTSGAENIGSKTIAGVAGNTPHAQATDLKAQIDARNAENVKLSGNQTVSGSKTFTSSPVVPAANADTQAPQKKYVDDENLKDVHLTGNQTVAGVKTFLSSPVVPTPTTETQAGNKGYIDAIAENFTLGAIPNASLTYDKQNAESKLTIEKQTFKNKIINGNFDIWQRGTTQTSNGYGSDDRWFNGHAGSTKTHSRQAFAVGQSEVPGNPAFYSRTVVVTGGTAGDFCAKSQRIEDVNTFSGETVTVSFYAKADVPKNISLELYQSMGSGGSPSADVSGIGAQKILLGTTWQKYTATISVPSVSGKTLGTNGDSQLISFLWFDAGTTFNTRTATLGNQSGTFDISQFQIEKGTVATTFEKRPITIERDLCFRYLKPLFSSARMVYYTVNTMAFGIDGLLKTMRTTPVISLTTSAEGTDFLIFNTIGTAVTGFVLSLANPVILLATKTAHGQTDGSVSVYSKIFADAEL